MDANGVIDDELQSRQADTGIRELLKVERAFRVADVHHDLDGQFGQTVELDFVDGKFNQTVVDPAGIPLGAGDGNLQVFLQQFGGIATTDDGRNTQLASDNSRMAGAASAVGYDRRGSFHHRLPIRVRHVRDQDIARLYPGQMLHIRNDPDGARTDALTNAAAGHQHLLAFPVHCVTTDDILVAA